MEVAQKGFTSADSVLDVQLDADKWQKLMSLQDSFVADVIQKRYATHQRFIGLCEAAEQAKSYGAVGHEEVELLKLVKDVEEQLEGLRLELRDKELRSLATEREGSERTSELLDSQLRSLQASAANEDNAESPKVGVRSAGIKGPRTALVLINGNVAPFGNQLIQNGKLGAKQAAELIRNQISLDLGTSDGSEPTIYTTFIYDRKALVTTLSSQQIISAPSTWKNFADAFSRPPTHHVIEIDQNAPVEVHMAAIVVKLGFMRGLERIYIAGTHPASALIPAVSKVGDQGVEADQDFNETVMAKVVLVKHASEDYLGEIGGPTVSFGNLFLSDAARPLGSGSSQAQTFSSDRPIASAASAAPSSCFYFYLGLNGCRNRVCPRSHDYHLTENQIERFKEEVSRRACAWQGLLTAQDDFVARLLNDEVQELGEIEHLRAQIPPTPPPNPDLEVRMHAHAYQLQELRREVADWTALVEETRQKVAEAHRMRDERQQAVDRLLASAPPRPSPPKSKAAPAQAGPPFILILIDASTAPFNEGAIGNGYLGGADIGARVRWEVEKDLREHNIELDEGEDEPLQPGVLCYVWHNKKALVYNLKQSRVLTRDDTWDMFMAGFSSIPNNQIMDCGEASIIDKMAAMIRTYGRFSNLKRIYLAGIHLESFLEAIPELRLQDRSSFHTHVAPKMVLIDHRETDDARDVLLTSSWRVARFLRFFSSCHGLGGDLGWALRAATPIVGPGDQNHEEGDDENGYEQVIETDAIKGAGSWVKVGKKGRAR
ncbi:uncharacterized protein JCM10292_007607 [Rhodotorula paludigena]|uniref:uncharacterized protein n=1 Tax=Rhodotorula paludigena TaxID=86838 RepID=UPI0031740D49